MLVLNEFDFGKLNCKIYNFSEIGDVLDEHTHDEESVHITIVCKGSLKMKFNLSEKIVKSGDIIDFKANQSHGFIAIEKNSKIINIKKII
jgi:quercetin dioxygenase-like cupin family protein